MKKTLVEFDQVLALANHNSELAKKLLLAFLSELKSAVEVFRESPNEEDMVAVSKLSHKIKPSLQLLQVESMNQVMNLYKMKYREGSVVAKAELPTIFHQIQSLYQEIVKEIEEYIRTTAQ